MFKHMRWLIVPVILLTGCQSTNKKVEVEPELSKCESEGALAFQYAVSKPILLESFAENPVEGTAGEAWRMLAYLHSGDEKYQKVAHETQIEIAKKVINSGFSDDFRIDAFLLRDYFELRCDSLAQGKTILAIQELEKSKVLSCWERRNASDDIKGCLALLAGEP